MSKYRQFRGFYKDTLANLNANNKIWPAGYILLATDGPQVRFTDGIHAFDDLEQILAQELEPADNIAPLGTTTNLTAIGGAFADLAAARSAVNTLKGEAEARLDAIEAKVDAIISEMIEAHLMAAS